LSVLFMLGWLWWGLLGLASVLVAVAGVCTVIRESSETEMDFKNGIAWRRQETRHRDRWLRQHFGEEGRRRWLLNLEAWEAFKAVMVFDEKGKAVRRLEAFKAAYPGWYDGARRNAAGGSDGFVPFAYSPAPWGTRPMVLRRKPQWGDDEDREYPSRHSAKGNRVRGREPTGGMGVHGEPMGIDWLAAGFWDPVVVDGAVVDPIDELRRDYRSYWLHEGFLFGNNLADRDFEARLVDEAREACLRTSGGTAPGTLNEGPAERRPLYLHNPRLARVPPRKP
jgi:hypothetical protein